MSLKVCKFGGTSMADAKAIRKVVGIISSDTRRRYVVVSAPGKRDKEDEKITDLLYGSCALARESGKCEKTFKKIRYRFTQIVKDLEINFEIEKELEQIEANINLHNNKHYAASRGEYLSALILAKILGWDFVDSKEIIKFALVNSSPELDTQVTDKEIAAKLKEIERAVIPGFYGSYTNHAGKKLLQDGEGGLVTFSRGGSDITGALVARAMKASVYENFTDVSGYYAADPKIVKEPRLISRVSYKELRELSYMGANVIHQDSIWPVQSAGIPINIKNTFALDDLEDGTMIMAEEKLPSHYNSFKGIVGIAGKKDFSVILIAKKMMNNKRGFCRTVLSVLEKHNISIDHIPSGIDTMSIVVANEQLKTVSEQKLLAELIAAVEPDTIRIDNSLALIAIVGRQMNSQITATVFNSLDDAAIKCRIIDQGSSPLNIIIGVDERNYERAIRAIYKAFFR
ncbi:MAG: aspartate kinase [Deltaproteobacteria bacterium]|nr:aspartate kinase [Deltaproteobacteria bacterium]